MNTEYAKNFGGDEERNGVRLPMNVILELQRLGRAIESYTSGELQAAVVACHMDGRLIDDPNGANFYDQLELTEAEKRKAHGIEEEEEELAYSTVKSGKPKMSFRERLEQARSKILSHEEQLAGSY